MPGVDQGVDAHAVEPTADQRAVEEPRTVVRDGDPVAAHRHRLRRPARRPLHHRPALDQGEHRGVGLGRRVVVQPPPAPARGQVDDDDPVGPLVRRVGQEGVSRLAAAEVEADVVDVARRQDHLRRERDDPGDPVRLQVDADQLGAAGRGRAELDAAGVDGPEPVARVDHDALHGDQVLPVARPGGPVGGLVGVGDRLAVLDLGDREVDLVAPLRVADEDAPGVRDRHAGGHRPVEGGDRLDLARRSVPRQVIRRAGRGWHPGQGEGVREPCQGKCFHDAPIV